MIKKKELLARILQRLIPMERTVVEEYKIFCDLITANNYAANTYNISKAGFYPVAVSSFSSNQFRAIPYRIRLQNTAEGTGQIAWGMLNTATSERTTTLTVYVLWEKIS